LQQSTLQKKNNDAFPLRILMIYILFYAGQAVYNNYIQIYEKEQLGMSLTTIGIINAIATAVIMCIKPIMGVVSDKSKNKNTIVGVMLLLCTAVGLAFYASTGVVWTAMCLILHNVFFNPAMSLQDGNAVEYLNENSKKWNFGHIRLGGSIGYIICSALIGTVLIALNHGVEENMDYRPIFWIMGIFFVITAFCHFSLPPVTGKRKKNEKAHYSAVFLNRPLLCIWYLAFMNSLGQAFMRFYTIHFNEIAGTKLVGILSATTALSEIPFFWFAGKIEQKIGTRNFLVMAGVVSVFKMSVYALTDNVTVILLASLITGFSFVGTQFCTVKFVNNSVPANIRSTAQTLNGLINMVISSIIVAPIAGALADVYGIQEMMLTGVVIMFLGVAGFAIMFPKAIRYQLKHPIEGVDMELAFTGLLGEKKKPALVRMLNESAEAQAISNAEEAASPEEIPELMDEMEQKDRDIESPEIKK